MKRKLLSLLLAFAFGAGMCVHASIASGTCGADADGANLTWEISDEGVLTISGTGAMKDYTSLGAAPWINYKYAITSVVAQEGVSTIGNYAFYQLSNIVSASMPSTMANIGGNAFASCRNLQEVDLKSLPNVNSVNTFKDCKALTTIWCPCDESLYYVSNFDDGYSYIRIIGYWDKLYRKCDSKHPAFNGICGANGEKNVTWKFEEGKVTLAGTGAMADCFLSPWNLGTAYVTELEIGDGITVIGANVFLGCGRVKKLDIPASVTTINEDAFFGLDSLAEMVCRAQTPPVWGSATTFQGVDRSIPVTVPKSKINDYKAADGWKEFTNYVGSEEEQTPEPCTESRQGTCGENLNWLITCEGELVITGSGAMTDFSYSNSAPWTAYLSEIKSVSLPEGLTHVGAWSIYQIPNIESVVIPEGVKSIGYVGFAGCRNLNSVTLPNSLETIGSMCFQSAALQTLYIPANVASIGEGITEECEALLSIVVSEDNSTFDSREGCNAIIKTANNTLIAGCKTTIIPNTVTAIGNFAFSSNRNVEDVRIPNSVESIGDYAFQYCSGFKDLVIPTSVTSISGTAFTGCAFATIMVVPGNPKFDSRDNCNAIIETATKKLIKGSEFTVMPDGITAFGEGAFMSNRNLKFINIPATVEIIEKNALIYCNNLKSITCLATVPPAAADLAFNYGAASSISIDPSIPVYVPGASIEAYKAAKNWSYFTNFVALDGYYTIKALATHGKVTGTGTYAANAPIELNAIPDEGFAFLEWTDGTTANPKELIVTKDETVRALFKMLDIEEEVAELSYQSDRMIITWDIIDEATIYIVNLYKAGVLLATYKTTDYVNFIELETYAPVPMRARRNFADEQPGKISFSIEGLEYGADYSYSIDAYDADEEVVNVIAGSFNTAEIPTDASAVNSQANAPRKMLNDGKLFISMPDGKSYDATGVQLK